MVRACHKLGRKYWKNTTYSGDAGNKPTGGWEGVPGNVASSDEAGVGAIVPSAMGVIVGSVL